MNLDLKSPLSTRHGHKLTHRARIPKPDRTKIHSQRITHTDHLVIITIFFLSRSLFHVDQLLDPLVHRFHRVELCQTQARFVRDVVDAAFRFAMFAVNA